jgi:hypothetical protein
MLGFIWCKEIESGKKQLKEIINDYKHCLIDCHRVWQTKNEAFAVFDNGDCWKVRTVNVTSRGQKCNISYIQRGIPTEFIDTVIKPMTVELPFNGFYYYP